MPYLFWHICVYIYSAPIMNIESCIKMGRTSSLLSWNQGEEVRLNVENYNKAICDKWTKGCKLLKRNA